MTDSDTIDAHDAMTAAPDHHEVLLENDQVRVLDTRLAAGQRSPVHSHRWPATLYVMSWSDFVRRDPDGKVMADSRSWERQPDIGEALWLPPLAPHSIDNVGDSELRLIAIELKQGS